MSESTPGCVIIGAGHAAAQCALSMRKDGWTGAITIVGDEPSPPYHRPPLSKAYLKREETPEQMWIRPLAAYEHNRIMLRTGARATGIDRVAKRVLLQTGEALGFERLVLATGSICRRPPIPGLDLPGVFFLRTLADAEAIREAAQSSARAVIIGGGYIGLEMAASFRALGLAVTVLEREERLLARIAPPAVSDFFRTLHESRGVQVRTGVRVERIEQFERKLRVSAQECAFEADLVVVGVGVAPAIELAVSAGLETDDGILVDEACRTSDPSIFAIGDCARQHHPLYDRLVRLESVQNAVDMGKTAAAAIAGKPIPPRPLPWFWSDQYDVKLQMAGLSRPDADVFVRGEPTPGRAFSVWRLHDGRVIAVDAVNDPTAYVVGGRLAAARAHIDPRRLIDPSCPLKSLLDAAKETPHA